MSNASITVQFSPQELEALLEVLIWLNDSNLMPLMWRMDESLGDWQKRSGMLDA